MIYNSISKDDMSSLLNYFNNRWIEIGLTNGYFLNFYFTDLNQYYIGGYLSRGSYKTISYIPSIPSMYLYDCLSQKTQHNMLYKHINKWVLLGFQRSKYLSFFLTYIDENFIGGYLTRNMIRTIDLSIVHYQIFFEEYDRRFMPKLISQNSQIPIKEREKRIQIVKRAERALFKRLEIRALASKYGKILNLNDMPSLDIIDVKYLSDKQLDLYKEFFLDENGKLDYVRIQTCFELFANGQIQGNKYPGNLQPNSAGDFLFAEFALQAIDFKINLEAWSELLKTFVKTQEIFIQVYRPNGIRNPKLTDYKYSNFKYYKQVSDKQKVTLRNKYDNMSKNELEQSYNKNLKHAQFVNSLVW
ncbi:hypothetical protein [Robertmurraya sp. P23]|uniref:hypothetical protein n=1 Tax=Robertmurraya sp. P23 TaxID=3436931 RepID=UPI003D98D838